MTTKAPVNGTASGAGAATLVPARGATVGVLAPGGGTTLQVLIDAALGAALAEHHVDLVVLAGFMRLLTPGFLAAFPGRVINIHPSLLPAFPGVNSQAQAFRHGVKVAGCTVHFVDAGVDTGPIIAQAAVAVQDEDDEEALRARILVEEHRILPAVVRAIAERRVIVEGRRVRVLAAKPSDEVIRSL